MFVYFLEHESLVNERPRLLDPESKELTVTPQDQAPSITSKHNRKSSSHLWFPKASAMQQQRDK
jgi:hypothetical protein